MFTWKNYLICEKDKLLERWGTDGLSETKIEKGKDR